MFAPGEIIDGKYRIGRQIGEGGMGAVFEAEAMRIHRRVAIKVLRTESTEDAEVAARFQLEAQAAGRIGSRHIVEVLDLGQLGSGAPYMVMEFLEGESLRAHIAGHAPMSVDALAAIADQLLTGVGAAHAAGIVHRDLKPDNVFLVRQSDGGDLVKLLDFGISKFDTGRDMHLTRTGALMGTPYYLSPEQANGSKVVDHRTDLYTVGVILYECLTGALPFAADTFNQLLFQIVLEPPAPLRERAPNADPEFVALVEKAMNKAPAQRFQSASEMRQALSPWTTGRSSGFVPGSMSLAPGGATLAAGAEAWPQAQGGDFWAQSGTPVSLGLGVDVDYEPKPKRRALLVVGAVAALSLLVAVSAALLRSSGGAPAASASVGAASAPVALPRATEGPPPTAFAAEPPPIDVVPAAPTYSEPSLPPPRADALPRPATAKSKRSKAAPAREAVTAAPPSTAPARPTAAAEPDVPRLKSGRAIRDDL